MANHIRYHSFLVVFWSRVAALGIEGYGDVAFVFRLHGLLLHIAIDILDLESCLRLYVVQRLGRFGEESIIEINNILLAAEVVAQFFVLRREACQFLLYILQDGPVAVTPTIDALFDVANEEVVAARRLVLYEQHLEVVPLQSAGILELVYHYVVELRAYLLENKRRIRLLHQLAQQSRGLAQVELVVLGIDTVSFLLYHVQQAQRVQVSERQLSSIDGYAIPLV